ncbi:uncharacterized protein B0H18DRAFT_1101883 [Fomitopsis serialis]|uniref:uncharacterized protein n=1 Tax=Fomitopsis serialis TaxID=139415 RepID=UPI002008D306|nr:uncharacterized protein B0H18DRAFT_1101883 [Neoantrodia serialis]KAH9933744.1 hypothetical protein B0H18DRAFT_1101883 [Neoantrodia serialis]
MRARIPVPSDDGHKDGPVGGERRAHLGLIPLPSKLLAHRNTWVLKMDTLLSVTSFPRCYVILVLGAPTYKDLCPILLSGHYAHSLVIIATHEPPEIPNLVIPALRILHLSRPLSAENTDTTRLADVMLWAEHVACDWRKYGGSGIYELAENDDDGMLPSGRRTALNVLRVGRHSARRHSMPVDSPSATITDGKRPFDVLVNFLPNQLPDNVLLRHTIYVTTIGRSFFKPSAATSSFREASLRKRALLTSKASTMRPLSSAASPQIIHLLPAESARYPQASARLVDSMEAFIAAFMCATSLSTDAKREADAPENVRSFIMHPTTFGKALDCALARLTPREGPGRKDDTWGCEWTVADVLISGALDSATILTKGATAPDGIMKTWISGPEDIALMPTGGGSVQSVPIVQDLDTSAVLYKTPRTTQSAPLRVSMKTAARTEKVVVEAATRRPDSPASTYSTSYGHEMAGISPPPSFHEYQDSAYLLGSPDGTAEQAHSDGDHPASAPSEVEEVPKSPEISPVTQELHDLGEIVLPSRVSIKRVQSLLTGWKDVGTWRSKRASIDTA